MRLRLSPCLTPLAHFVSKSSSMALWAWLVLGVWLFAGVASKQCLKIDACKCGMDDGSGMIDISPLGLQNGQPAFAQVPDNAGYKYSYNPCFSFSEGTCSDASVCQSFGTDSWWKAGDQASATWSYDGTNVQVTYQYTSDITRKSIVTFKCDPTADKASMIALGDSSYGVYVFEVTSKVTCPGIHITVTVSIGIGSILLICFFALLLVYLVAGIVFNRVRRQATGADMIPNVTFWSELPRLIKDGVLFAFSGLRRVPSHENM